MTYATQQLTHALQELTASSQQVAAQPRRAMPAVISSRELKFSREVENFLAVKCDYAARTRAVNIGSY